MLTDTDIDPNMVGRGEIDTSKEESKTHEFDNGKFLIEISIELWTPLQIACFHGYYKIVAILLSDPRTVANFTTSATADPPQVIAEKMTYFYKEDEKAKPGVSHIKCIELIED